MKDEISVMNADLQVFRQESLSMKHKNFHHFKITKQPKIEQNMTVQQKNYSQTKHTKSEKMESINTTTKNHS
jgi:phage gp45-like